MAKGGVIQQVGFEVAQQIAHRQQGSQLRNLPRHLLGFEIFHALEVQRDSGVGAAIDQGVFHCQFQARRELCQHTVEVIFIDANFISFR
ncbi:hypothetical protein D3C71_1948430 [compost metagenome]